jgi:hypothetical protein
LQFVKVIGEAKEDPISGKITSILIHDIQRLEDREKERLDLIPQGTPIPIDFWKSMSLEELAQAQDAQPINDVSTLFGTWPGSPDDGFEEIIMGLRKQNMLMKSQEGTPLYLSKEKGKPITSNDAWIATCAVAMWLWLGSRKPCPMSGRRVWETATYIDLSGSFRPSGK